MIKIGEGYFIQFPTVRALVAIRSKAVPVPYRTLRAVLQDVTKIKVIRKKVLKCCVAEPSYPGLSFRILRTKS